jgi:hypothetical protein
MDEVEKLLEQLFEAMSEELLPRATEVRDDMDSFKHIFEDTAHQTTLKKILEANAEVWALFAGSRENNYPEAAQKTILAILAQTTVWTYCKGFTDAQKQKLETWKVAEEK